MSAACGDSALLAFRPLFVGIKWDSDWPRAGVLGVEDYWNKGSDADEIGLTWANLLNRVLKEVRAEHGARIVAVGHSFGARLLSRAVHSAPLIVAGPSEPIDLFIRLQGAFPYRRFVGLDVPRRLRSPTLVTAVKFASW
jgi:Alpha/beta hydrolase family